MRTPSLWLSGLLAVLAACDTDPSVPASTCTSSASCPFGQLCDTRTSACVAEPTDGFAGAFGCTLYDDASHPLDPSDHSAISEVVGTPTGTSTARYTFYLSSDCVVYTKHDPPFLQLDFDAEELGAQGEILSVFLPWPITTEFDLARSETDQQIGSGLLEGTLTTDSTYAPRLAYVTGGHVHLDATPQPGTRLSGYLDATASATQLTQPPLLTDCSTLGLAACGQAVGGACSTFGNASGKNRSCTFACAESSACADYGGVCDTSAGVCTKSCGTAASCPSWLGCSATSFSGGATVCN